MKQLQSIKLNIQFKELEDSFEKYIENLKDTGYLYHYPYKEYYIYNNRYVKFINNNYQTKKLEFWDGEQIIRLNYNEGFSLISASLKDY